MSHVPRFPFILYSKQDKWDQDYCHYSSTCKISIGETDIILVVSFTL